MIALSRSTSSVRSAEPGRWRRAYVFAVSGLAAFFVALAVQRDMGSDYQATARLTAAAAPTQPVEEVEKEVQEMRRLMTANETVQLAVQAAGIRPPSGIDSQTHSPSTVTDIRRQLAIERASIRGDEVELQLRYTGKDEEGTISLVNALADQAVRLEKVASRRRSGIQREAEKAEKAARQAAQDWAEARRKRDTFVAVNERLLSGSTEPPVAPVLPAPAKPSTAFQDATRQRIAELTIRLQSQEVVRKQLLATMTPEHPHYQLVRDQIAQLQAEIDEANRSLAASDPAPVAEVPVAVVSPKPVHNQQALLAELGRLEQHVVALKQQQETLLRAATEARQLAEAQTAPETWVVHPAESALRISRPTSVPSVLLALAIGILTGSATLLIGGAVRTIAKGADIEALGVRLLGTLPDQGEMVAGASRLRHGPSRWVLWGSEATLALFLAAMVVVAIQNHEFARQIAADPLSGLAEGVRRLPSVFGGPVI